MTKEFQQLSFNFVGQDDPATQRTADIAYLLNCYDIWSATPSRGCDCGAPLVSTD